VWSTTKPFSVPRRRIASTPGSIDGWRKPVVLENTRTRAGARSLAPLLHARAMTVNPAAAARRANRPIDLRRPASIAKVITPDGAAVNAQRDARMLTSAGRGRSAGPTTRASCPALSRERGTGSEVVQELEIATEQRGGRLLVVARATSL